MIKNCGSIDSSGIRSGNCRGDGGEGGGCGSSSRMIRNCGSIDSSAVEVATAVVMVGRVVVVVVGIAVQCSFGCGCSGYRCSKASQCGSVIDTDTDSE